MALLLDKRGDEILITKSMVAMIVGRFDHAVVDQLLDKRGDEIQITDDVVKAAAANEDSGQKITALLLDKRKDEIQITDDVVKAAAANEDKDVVKAAAQTSACNNVVEFLLKQRRAETTNSITPQVCSTAAACGQLDSLKFLCGHISPADVVPAWGDIARLYRASETGVVNGIKEVLQKKVPLNTRDTFGRTPLWIAANNGQAELVKLLVQQTDVDIDCLSTSGRSPIFWPSANGDEDIVKILVSAGAKTYFEDIEGQTAVSIARKNGHENIVRILLDSEAAQQPETALIWRKPWKGWLSLLTGFTFLGVFGGFFALLVLQRLIQAKWSDPRETL
ncbi:HET domain protein [Colletotrichum tofieldiae]|nr:HET domain protein [Colletotrichum tofieldiae]